MSLLTWLKDRLFCDLAIDLDTTNRARIQFKQSKKAGRNAVDNFVTALRRAKGG